MKILVALKRVADPDNANKVKIPADGSKIDTTGLEWKPNPFDEYALETALRLTEDGKSPKARKGEVVAVTFGPKDTETTLRAALATGADRAIRVDAADEQLDGSVVAKALKTLVQAEKPDLVLLGKQAVDGDTNQVGQILAELLDWPQATFAATIRAESSGSSRASASEANSTAPAGSSALFGSSPDGSSALFGSSPDGSSRGALLVGREVDGGVLEVRVKLPAVVTVDLRIVAPQSVYSQATDKAFRYNEGVRFAPLPAIMQARKKPLDAKSLAELTGDKPRVRYLKFEAPPARKAGVKVADVDALIDKLHNEAKVL